jgi:hypothetical protein
MNARKCQRGHNVAVFSGDLVRPEPDSGRKIARVKMRTLGLRTIFMSAVLAATVALAASPQAQTATSQRLVVVVNDHPITDYDVDQRMRLNEVLGNSSGSEAQQRKAALEGLIDDVIKRAEAKRLNLEPTEQQVAEAIERMARNTGSTVDGLTAILRPKGVSMNTLKQYVSASLAFNWIANRQYNVQVNVDPSEVDRRLASMKSDPRFKPVLGLRTPGGCFAGGAVGGRDGGSAVPGPGRRGPAVDAALHRLRQHQGGSFEASSM